MIVAEEETVETEERLKVESAERDILLLVVDSVVNVEQCGQCGTV